MVRFKNRYITVEITPKDNQEKPLILKPSALQNAIQEKVAKLYGDFGQAAIRSGFTAKYCNAQTRLALIKIRHGPHKFVLDAVRTINDVGGRLVEISILYVGATMKHCFLYIKKYQQKKLEEMWFDMRNDMEREKMQEALMTLTSATKQLN